MPPRLPLTSSQRCTALVARRPIDSLSALLAGLSFRATAAPQPAPSSLSQSRPASILSSLSNNKGAYSKRKRVGRGPSSGYGKTSGRGHKGQGQHGKVKAWFQGGQTPLIFVKGRKGFENHRAPVMSQLNLDRVQEWISAGRLDPSKPITPKEIISSGLIGSVRDGIKLLARNASTLTTPVDIVVSRASAAAIQAVEAAGGKITTRYYTKQSLWRLLRGESEHTITPLPVGPEHVDSVLEARRKQPTFLYRLPDPTSRRDIEYYRDPAHRGYLSHLLKPGESPSLYFRVPNAAPTETKTKKKDPLLEDANRLF